MSHKKIFSAAVIAVIFVLLTCQKVLAASRNITSLKLDFLRTEEVLQNPQTQPSTMAGTIIYNKNPFIFIFELKEPLGQTMYINQAGAWLLDKGKLYSLEENLDFLQQTCQDFLNWFKADYGLQEASFRPGERWLEAGAILTQWDCYSQQEQPLNKVLVYSDSHGRFCRLKMFANSQTLVTDTKLNSFENSQGFAYPTLIVSTSYDNNQPFLITTLNFSNVHFVLSKQELAQIDELTKESPVFADYPAADFSDLYEITKPLAPQAAGYRVSLPSVITGASFKFYKAFITSQDMSNCPFYPSCSQFMLEAVQANGIFGFFQGLERLKRCTSTEHKRNQYPTLSNGKHYDPVPVKEKK